ncbi:unnamed protein product, partial [Heterotrigona itama]
MLAFKCQLTPLNDDVCIKAVPCCDCEKTIYLRISIKMT